MNRTRVADSDDEADESMPKPPTTKMAAKSGSSNQKLQHRHQEKTGSADDSNSVNSDSVDEDSLEEKKQEVGTSTSSQVCDFFMCIVTFGR